MSAILHFGYRGFESVKKTRAEYAKKFREAGFEIIGLKRYTILDPNVPDGWTHDFWAIKHVSSSDVIEIDDKLNKLPSDPSHQTVYVFKSSKAARLILKTFNQPDVYEMTKTR